MKKENRRMKRMTRQSKAGAGGLSLVSLMDVFTILVFFLLVNSASSDVMEPPKNIKLPDSAVETKPRETVIVMITPTQILVQGEPVISTQEVVDSKIAIIEQVKDRLILQKKKVMASCTSAGYGKISLAVIQKAKSKG